MGERTPEYGKVWATLHPRYQRVTTRAFWESCKRKLAEKRGFSGFRIRAIDAYPDRVTLPLLGTIRVIAVTLQARIVDRQRDLGTASDTHLWVKVGSRVEGVVDDRAVPRLQGSPLPRYLTS